MTERTYNVLSGWDLLCPIHEVQGGSTFPTLLDVPPGMYFIYNAGTFSDNPTGGNPSCLYICLPRIKFLFDYDGKKIWAKYGTWDWALFK